MPNKVRIKMLTIGFMPKDFNLKKISQWQSKIFEIAGVIENFALRTDSDGKRWDFSDVLIKKQIPSFPEVDIIVALVNVPIEDNWYSRRLGDNKIVITFNEIKEILIDSNIPLENVVLRLLYSYALVFRENKNNIPTLANGIKFTHDETRGCIFDMNGLKVDLPASCDKPQICDECQERLKKGSVSIDAITSAQKEMQLIRKNFYYRILEFIKTHPIWALIISSFYAILLNVVASLIMK